jgi:tetratricopeptide (TPR) repeat protein
VLLGKAFLSKNNFELAETNFKRASEIINSEKTFNFYFEELKKVRAEIGERDSPAAAEDTKQLTQSDSRKVNREKQLNRSDAIEERLDQLAADISNARIKRTDESDIQKADTYFDAPGRSKILSETLAKIYLSQGERDEAIKVYEELIKRNPEKENYYSDKIREIRSS